MLGKQNLMALLSSVPGWRRFSYRGNTLAEETRPDRFALPKANPDFHFPKDDGAHPEFRIEWWYLCSHLFSSATERFGLQATFFRLAHDDSQYFMSHMAISDGANQTFVFDERIGRDSDNVSFACGSLDVKHKDWSLKGLETGTLRLCGSVRSKYQFHLDMHPEKEQLIFGEGGIMKKSPDAAASSYYLNHPRLSVSGTCHSEGGTSRVEGEAWMDHEIASRQLATDQTGWNWIQIQFFDGWELMAYSMRGGPDMTTVVWIAPDGGQTNENRHNLRWHSGGHWESTESEARYPIRPEIETFDPRTDQAVTLRFRPLLEDQEVRSRLGIVYWEGAGDIYNEGGALVGRSFLELTGYVGRLSEILR